MNSKKPDFAGSWYPDSSSECKNAIESFLSETGFKPVSKKERVAGIVPHAGWFFSGSLACRVISHLAEGDKPDAVVIYGRHNRPEDRSDIMVGDMFETPLGHVPVHKELTSEISEILDLKKTSLKSARPDNTIELQLPFIRYFFPDVPVVVIGVSPNINAVLTGEETVKAAGRMGLSIKITGSTDLTHYGPNYGFTPYGSGASGLAWTKEENDSRIVEKMLNMDKDGIVKEALSRGNACCAGAIAATVSGAELLGADKGELLAYTTSYDKSPGHSFVGYAAVLF